MGWFALLFLIPTGAARADEPQKPTETASETNPAVPAQGHSVHGEAFNEGPRQRARLLSGMGEVSFPVTTTSSQAQDFIEQGVAQIHTFYYLEAERSFRQAAMLDPSCPMAYWGMAMANTNNPKRAKGFLAEVRKRAEGVELTRREQLYLDALAAKYREQGDDKGRRQAHLLGLETIVQEFPDDLNARTWLAMVTWENSSKGDGIGSRQAVEELIRSVERVAPMHPGMHHYRIHLWDGVKPAMALESAALYGKAAPEIAHAWHMPGHTYTGLKRYADAAYQQEASARVDHAAMDRDRLMPFEIHNYAHNNQWFCTSASHVGRVRDGIAVARNLVEQPRDPKKNGPNDGGSSQRSGRARWSELLDRYEMWDDLIAATESGALDWSDSVPFEKKQKHYLMGLALAARGDRDRLVAQIEALRALRPAGEDSAKDTEPDDASPPAEQAKAKAGNGRRRPRSIPGLDAALAELEAHQRRLDGDADGALALLDKATSMRPEAKARFLTNLGHHDKAVEAARNAVRRGEKEFPPLACLVETLHRADRDDEAKEAYRTLIPLLREADRDTPISRRLEEILSGWKGGGWQEPTLPEDETDLARANRIDLDSLGPLTYQTYAAEPLNLPDASGNLVSLESFRGKSNVLVLFYLGGKCAHCMQQLQVFGEQVDSLRQFGTEIIGVSTDAVDATAELKFNEDGIAFPMKLLSDPSLAHFKAYRAFDDFENLPLHGTFLIDRSGQVRYQNISYEPFLDVEFIRQEAARINRLQDWGR